MGIVEIKGDDPYIAEGLVREIFGRLSGEKGEEWEKLFAKYGEKYGVYIVKFERKTIKGKFQLPEAFCPTPVVKNIPEMICGGEHEWETTEGEETFEARCVKCGFFYRFEVYE